MKKGKDFRPQIQEIARLVGEGKCFTAESTIDQLRKHLPEQADLLHLKGRCRLLAGDPAGAIEWVERAMARHPDFSEFHLTQGRAKEILNDTGGAEQAYREAVRLSQGANIEAVTALIDLLLGKGGYAEVLTLSIAALQLAPTNVRLLFVAGLSCAKLGNFKDAQRYYERVIELKPNQAEAHNNLGNILRRIGKRQEALLVYGNALRLAPGYADAGYNHAATLLDLGRSEEAYAAFIEMARQHPEMAACWGGLAEAALKSEERSHVLALAKEQIESDGAPIGPLAAICYLTRFAHDYHANIEAVQRWGYKLQSALPSDHMPYLIASDYVISRWLAGQVDGLDGYLQALIVGMKQASDDLGRTRIFYQLLLRLIQARRMPKAEATLQPILTCIGDSHALSVAGAPIEINGRTGCVSSFFVMGAKAYHLGLDAENRFKTGLELAFIKAPKDRPVLLCFGEIDCRLWEGIIPAWRKGKFEVLAETIREQVRAYVEHVHTLACNYGLSLWFQGVPAPNLDWQRVPADDKALLVRTIQLFNQALEQAANKQGCRYVDTYALTAGPDGVSNKKWHLDAHHLRSEYLQYCLVMDVEQRPTGASHLLLDELKALVADRQIEQAFSKLQSIPEATPGLAVGWTMLGTSYHQAGDSAKAKQSYQRAIAIEPGCADAHNNLGVLRLGENDPSGALACFEAACRQMPGNVDYQRNRGVLQERLGDLAGAEATYRMAIGLTPDDHRPHVLLAQLIKAQGRLEEAAVCYRAALRVRPDIPEVHFNLGQTLRLQAKFNEAAASYRAAWQINPEFMDARVNEGRALLAGGNVLAALDSAVTTLSVQESQRSKSLCAECLRQPFPIESIASSHLPRLRHLLTRALDEAWTRPTYLQSTAVRFVRETGVFKEWKAHRGNAVDAGKEEYSFGERDWDELCTDMVLNAALRAAPMPDMLIGDYLSSLRRQCLLSGQGAADVGEGRLAFMCVLASQCFINEYILPLTEEERIRSHQLACDVESALQGGKKVDSWSVACVAAYYPLYKLHHAQRLLGSEWPEAVRRLLILQVAEPLEEQKLRVSIPCLTQVVDEVSSEVRRQYEENPYPRWLRPAPIGEIADIDTRMRRNFPHAHFQPLRKGGDIDLLIAGCGTGQQSVEAARNHPKARILAVDLSLSSLAYAIRKTRELKIENVEYAQADILQLGAIGRTFDVIESSGVLHHLSCPEQGWRVLLDLLRPGGFMNIGLYSELARQNVVAARNFIAAKGYPETVEGIRACRAAMFATAEDAPWKSVCRWADFYSTSACRDLIFHVQEHRFTIPRIKKFLVDNNLTFLGFSFEARTLSRYRERFPADLAATDLDKWHMFELENPETFAGMYQFWVQKR